MANISIIVAVTKNMAIGRGGDLLFHISEDLRQFKVLTMGHPIIMGRKTFESFPNGALPGRRNIVITRQADYVADGAETVGSLQQAIDAVEQCDEAFVIGGGEIYSQALPHASKLYLTIIDADVADADTFFPQIAPAQWETIEESEVKQDPRSGATYRFICLSRK